MLRGYLSVVYGLAFSPSLCAGRWTTAACCVIHAGPAVAECGVQHILSAVAEQQLYLPTHQQGRKFVAGY